MNKNKLTMPMPHPLWIILGVGVTVMTGGLALIVIVIAYSACWYWKRREDRKEKIHLAAKELVAIAKDKSDDVQLMFGETAERIRADFPP